MFTLGIPLKQKRRTLGYLSNEYFPGGMKKLGQVVDYKILSTDDGFFQLGFPGMDEDEFRDITFKLKQQGVTVIGADSQLTEKTMKLVNLVPLKESLQVTTNNGKVAIISDPEDIKTFYKGGTVFGDDNDGDSIELSKETSLDFQSIKQEGSCGYARKDEDPNKADQPAGPHLLRKKIREMIEETFQDNPNVPGVTGMEDAEGKVRDNMLAVIPDNYGYKDLAKDIAFIIQDAYGSHNIKPFMKELSQKFQQPNY